MENLLEIFEGSWIQKKNIEDQKLFFKKCYDFGIERILKDVAFSEEIPRLNKCFYTNSIGF